MSSADLAVSGRLGTSSLRARPWATVTVAEARSEIAASGWRITSWVWSGGLQSFGTARLEIYRSTFPCTFHLQAPEPCLVPLCSCGAGCSRHKSRSAFGGSLLFSSDCWRQKLNLLPGMGCSCLACMETRCTRMTSCRNVGLIGI